MNIEKYLKKYNDNVRKKIEYFIKFWEYSLSNVTSELFGLTLYSPHILLKDLLDEYKYNQMKNNDNNNMFKKKLEYYKKENPIIKKFYSLQFNELNKCLGNGNYEYANELTKCIYSYFVHGDYFDKCFDYLIEILFDENDCNINHIKLMTNDLIIEFIIKGVPIKQIKKNFANVLDGVRLVGEKNDTPVTNFPLGYLKIKYSEFKKNKKMQDLINNLDINDRLKAIKSFYLTKKEKYFVIISVTGLTISTKKSYKIKDIEFYSPKHQKKISDSIFSFFENEQSNSTKNSPLKAYIPIKATSPLFAYEIAKKKLDAALSLLRISNMGYPYCEIDDKYVVLDSKNKVIMAYYGKQEKYHQNLETKKTLASYNPVDIVKLLNKNKLTSLIKNFDVLFNSKIEKFSVLEEKLYFSLKWIINAEDNENSEEKLMAYWIAIENLINLTSKEHDKCIFINKKNNEKETKIELAQEIISSIDSINLCISFIQNLFDHIRNNVYNFYPFSQRTIFNIEKEILHKCNIKEKYRNDKINIIPFINNIQLLKEKTTDYYTNEKILFIEKICKNNNYAYDVIQKLKDDIKDDILYLYRYRNLISHNAHIDMTFLEFYCEKAKMYSINLFLEIMNLYSKNKNLTLAECLLNIKIEKDLNIIKLKNNNITNLFDVFDN